MGDSYGWSDDGRHVFDPLLLEKAAAELRKQNTGDELAGQLADALLPPSSFGKIPGGPAAQARLKELFDTLKRELANVGIDFNDLASRTLAASQLAASVEQKTAQAARRGSMYTP